MSSSEIAPNTSRAAAADVTPVPPAETGRGVFRSAATSCIAVLYGALRTVVFGCASEPAGREYCFEELRGIFASYVVLHGIFC